MRRLREQDEKGIVEGKGIGDGDWGRKMGGTLALNNASNAEKGSVGVSGREKGKGMRDERLAER